MHILEKIKNEGYLEMDVGLPQKAKNNKINFCYGAAGLIPMLCLAATQFHL